MTWNDCILFFVLFKYQKLQIKMDEQIDVSFRNGLPVLKTWTGSCFAIEYKIKLYQYD